MKIENFTLKIFLTAILIVASFLRFYNLMFDSPYFFNPDERNMANAIVQMQMPQRLKDWPECIWEEVASSKYQVANEENAQLTTHNAQQDCNLHPHFFAYGQFPLYLSFFSDQIVQHTVYASVQTDSTQRATDYTSAIFWLRFWSAFSSVGSVLIVYLITKLILRTHAPTTILPHLAALLTAVTPGLIQSAHFGTTESLLTFFLITSVYLSLRLVPPPASLMPVSLLALVCGFAFGTKLTGLFCLVPAALAAVCQLVFIIRTRYRRTRKSIRFVASWLIFFGLTVAIGVVASPYNLIDAEGFTGSVFGYEKDVATGAYKAFYTRQFEGTVPILFQMKKIFPFALGTPLFILGLSGFLFTIGSLIWQFFQALWKAVSSRQLAPIEPGLAANTTQVNEETEISMPASAEDAKAKEKSATVTQRATANRQLLTANCQLLILILSFLAYLVPNSILYAKWTRFVTPIFPFFSVFAALFLYQCIPIINMLHRRGGKQWSIGILVLMSLLPGLAFFSIYVRDDVRVTASKWIYATIPDQSYILFDTANVIDIPLGLPADDQQEKPRPNYTTISFDFYHLEENAELLPKLLIHLENADYIFVPSRRIFANHLPRAKEFPTAAAYYRHLFDGSLGFEEVARFTSFPSLGPIQFPDEHAEETSTVFDHPVIRIYKKIRPMSAEEYRSLVISD